MTLVAAAAATPFTENGAERQRAIHRHHR